MYRRTDGQFGVNEALFSSALAAMVFSIFGAQPLTIVGITGLISLFNYTIYEIIKIYDLMLFERFMVWVGIWAAIFHWLFAVCNICDYMRFVTDFSSESFAMYVGIIYISKFFPGHITRFPILNHPQVKGVEELAAEFTTFGPAQGYMSCMIAILYFGTIYALEAIGQGTLIKPWVRSLLADYAYPVRFSRPARHPVKVADIEQIGTIFWVGFAHIPGPLKRTNISFLPTSRAFYPTAARSWVPEFWTLPVKWVFVALPIGFLVMLLFYYDHVRAISHPLVLFRNADTSHRMLAV